MASKIIVTGAINGQLSQLFTKLRKLLEKNAFSFAVVTGDLFAAPDNATKDDEATLSELLQGSLEVPLPTYFTIGQHALPPVVTERLEAQDSELCTNLYFLGKRSTTKTSEGIRIVALGGNLDAQIAAGESKDKFLPFHTESDARTLRGANNADILFTTHWPTGIRNGSKVELPEGNPTPRSEQCVAELCAALRPRYHFSMSPDAFFEREPFTQPPPESSPDTRPITRFISLASITSTSKAKWLYAFSLDPKAPSSTAPAGTTPSPFASARKRTHPPSHSAQPAASTGMRNPKRRKKPQPPPGPAECFFCLANPNLSTHILTSIGDQAYLSTAKGPLLETSTFPELPFQSHILIIPMAHAATLASIPDKTEAAATFAEMQRYRHALQRMILSKGSGAYGAVAWELSRNSGVHAHWQFMPLPRKLLADGLVEAAFRVQAENAEYPAPESRDVGDGSGEGDFFRVWIWTPPEPTPKAEPKAEAEAETKPKPKLEDLFPEGEEEEEAAAAASKGKAPPPGRETQLVFSLADVPRFDVSFGRRVVAQLLQLPARVDWKECRQSEALETSEAEAFKVAFKQWDFALE